MHAAVIVNPTGDSSTLTLAQWAVVHSTAMTRAASANQAKHGHWPSRRSPASFPWGAVLVGEAE